MKPRVGLVPGGKLYLGGKEAGGKSGLRGPRSARTGCQSLATLATAAWGLNLVATSRRTAYWFDRHYWETPSSRKTYDNRTVGSGRMGKYCRGQVPVDHEVAANIDVRFPGTLAVLDHVIWQLLDDHPLGPSELLPSLARCLPRQLSVGGLIREMTADDESESIRFDEMARLLGDDIGHDAEPTLDRLACLIALHRLSCFQMDYCRIRPGFTALLRLRQSLPEHPVLATIYWPLLLRMSRLYNELYDETLRPLRALARNVGDFSAQHFSASA